MRKLNNKQKKLLKEWFKDHRTEVSLFFDVARNTNFSFDLYTKIINLNAFETINQEINNYVTSLLK